MTTVHPHIDWQEHKQAMKEQGSKSFWLGASFGALLFGGLALLTFRLLYNFTKMSFDTIGILSFCILFLPLIFTLFKTKK